jgi:hypothetical protein
LLTDWRVGDESSFICFDFAVRPGKDVKIHSHLVQSSDLFDEVFLCEIVSLDEALSCAISMVEDAMEYLQEIGVDDPLWVDCQSFVSALMVALQVRIH